MEAMADRGITVPAGFTAGATYCGIKMQKLDLCIVYSDRPAAAAGVFTTNKVKAAPIYVCQEHLQAGTGRAIIVNSGNANACTGEAGLADAREMASLVAGKLGLTPFEV